MGVSTQAREFRKAVFDRCELLYAGDVDPYTRVSRGLPAFADAQDNVSVGAVTFTQEPIVLSPQRQREETLTCQVMFYSFRFGGADMEEVVEARAYEMLDALAQYVRVTDTTLGNVVRHCFLTDGSADEATNPDLVGAGRMHVLSATLTAVVRVGG